MLSVMISQFLSGFAAGALVAAYYVCSDADVFQPQWKAIAKTASWFHEDNGNGSARVAEEAGR